MTRFVYQASWAGALILIGWGIYWIDPGFFPTMFFLSVHGDVHGAATYLKSFGVWAMAISFLLLVVINVLGFLPNVFLLIANGFVFGMVNGILISWAGECAGAALGFFTMRHLFRDKAQVVLQKAGYEEKVAEFSSRDGFGLILAGRMLPFMPSGALTAAGAMSSISFRKYMLATCLGKMLSVSIEVLSGHDVVSFHEHMPRLIGLGMVSLLMIGGYFRYVKRCNNCR